MLKSKINGLCIALSVVTIVIAFLLHNFFAVPLSKVAERAGESLNAKSGECDEILNSVISNPSQFNRDAVFKAYEEKNIGVYLFNNDSLIFWNNAQLPVNSALKQLSQPAGLLKLTFGFYLYHKLEKGSYKAYASCVVKPVYDLQNLYLKNHFSEWTKIPKGIELNEKTGTGADVILNNSKLFSLKGEEDYYFNPRVTEFCAVLFLIGFLVLMICLLVLFKQNNSYKALFFCLLPLIIFKVIIGLKPTLLAHTFLYDLRLFADAHSYLNGTLADLVYNSIALLFISVMLHLRFHFAKSNTEKIIRMLIMFLLVLVIVWQYNHSIKSLVENSTLSFDFLSVFNIRFAAVIALLSIVFNSLALFVALYRTCSFFDKSKLTGFIQFLIFSFLICIAAHIVSPMDNFIQDLWPFLFAIVLYALLKLQYQKFSLGLGILILVMSAVTSAFFNYYLDKDEKQLLKELSYSLSERQDPLLESEFLGLPEKIANDEKLKVLMAFLPGSEKEIVQVFKQKFFTGYFTRYNIDFSLFDPNCKPLLMPAQAILLNEGFFEDQIKFNSDSTYSPGLFFVKTYKKNSRYIGKIKIEDKSLYVLLEPKQFEELGSFPDLLLDQSQQKEDLKNASYAVYRTEQNTNRYGDFNYPYYFRDSASLANSQKDYVHHFYSTDESTQIIISKKAKNWNYRFTYNSYLFLFFSVVSFICYYIYAYLFTSNFRNASLTRRIQTIVIVLLLLAMSAVGITSGNLVSRQFETDNIRQLQEKTQIIINELGTQFKPEELFSSTQKDLVNLKLKELTHLFNTDISLFDDSGNLYNTSQPKLYEKGLAATIANPKAYFNLKENRVSAYSDTEMAGTLKYLSFYTPVFNSKKELLGFVNLPYFARQSDLVNELSGIISALINVYVILFVISILAGLILAGYITKPLRLIKQQIANITLGKQNETINWTSNDEVGKLVNEYNNMLLKLEHSANLLAQSEREGAWREMAKQVAHEIKNPLTPMKLNLQYLQHLMKNNPADFKEKFEKTSASIIEQIDTLAGIATEFSNFAKLPGTHLQEINLTEIINSTVHLFDKEASNIIRNNLPTEDLWVTGDKEQALRVFNNIIKNAIHATEEVKEPLIKISAIISDTICKVIIEDNGCGIPTSMRDKIFEPNFTTKSTGSGLGLAIVKSIMNSFGGRIYFESQENKGTTFYIEFVKSAPA